MVERTGLFLWMELQLLRLLQLLASTIAIVEMNQQSRRLASIHSKSNFFRAFLPRTTCTNTGLSWTTTSQSDGQCDLHSLTCPSDYVYVVKTSDGQTQGSSQTLVTVCRDGEWHDSSDTSETSATILEATCYKAPVEDDCPCDILNIAVPAVYNSSSTICQP